VEVEVSRAFYIGWVVMSLGLAVWQFGRAEGAWVALNLGIAAFAGWKAWEGGDE
jgi:hypothetical protein